MHSFLEQLKNDLDNVFFNSKEFAEEVNIDGKQTMIILDNDLLEKQKLTYGEGLANSELLFHVKKIELETEPSIGDVMNFNNDIYRISNISKNTDVFTITLAGRFS